MQDVYYKITKGHPVGGSNQHPKLHCISHSLYASTADSKKLKMILEITTTFFPLLISVIVGLNVALEEKASHFQTLLAVPNRHKNMLAKLTYLYGSGVFALFFLFLLFVIGIHLLGIVSKK